MFEQIKDLVFAVLPAMPVHVGPGEILIAIGLAGLIWSERDLLR